MEPAYNSELSLAGPATVEHIDFDALDSFRFADGEGFPESYKTFVQRAGWARTLGMWLIYPPVRTGYADGRQRAVNLTARFLAMYEDGQAEEFDWMVEPDGDWDSARSLQVFGWSENGDALLWDTSARDEHGEFAVWQSLSLNSLHRLGNSLTEALSILRARTHAMPDSARGADIVPLSPARI